MKKTFVLSATTKHKESYTKRMLDILTQELAGFYNFDLLDTYDEPVKPCNGCRYCVSHTHCIYNDYSKIDTGLRQSDLLIIATPIFNLSFPSPLKAVLDRTQIYYNDRFIRGMRPPIQKHKECILLSSCGSLNTIGFDIITQQLEMIFTVLNTSLSHKIFLPNTDARPNINGIKHEIIHTADILKT